MKYKIIKHFLLNYNESRWKKLIPSLLEIAILNLHISFKTNFFSEKDLENIINDLKSNFKQKLRNNEISNKTNLDEIIIEKSKKEYIDINKRRKTGKNKNKEREIYENYEYYEDGHQLNVNENQLNSQKKNIRKKSNYAISYDKNLNPEIIEKKELKNKKGEKIVKRMTQEEYNALYDSQGEERQIQNINNKNKNKSKNKKTKKNRNYNNQQMPDQDGEYNNNLEQDYQEENGQEFNEYDDEENNEQKGFYDEQGNYHEYEEQNQHINNNNQGEYNRNNNENNNDNDFEEDNNNYN